MNIIPAFMSQYGLIDNGIKFINLMPLSISHGYYSRPRWSHWVVKVDKCTGEEHVFRVRSPSGGSVVKA